MMILLGILLVSAGVIGLALVIGKSISLADSRLPDRLRIEVGVQDDDQVIAAMELQFVEASGE